MHVECDDDDETVSSKISSPYFQNPRKLVLLMLIIDVILRLTFENIFYDV